MLKLAFSSLVALSISLAVDAQAAPAGTPLEFQVLLPILERDGLAGCLTASSNADGAPVVFHNCDTLDDTTSSIWTVVAGGGPAGSSPAGQIKIFGNKCLDNTNGVNADGNPLQIWTCTDGDTNQLWNVNDDNTITLSTTNKCVDLTNGNINDGNRIQIWDCTANDLNQQWAPVASHTVQILTASDTQCIAAGPDVNGAPVTIQDCAAPSNNLNTTWVIPADGQTGTISTFTGRATPAQCLDVTNGVNADGTKLQTWACTPGDTNQQFFISGGTITWVGTGKCVDLTNGNSTNGNQLQVWDCTGGPNQAWIFFEL